MPTHSRAVLAALLFAVAMLFTQAQPTAYADNSKEANRVVVCVAVYHGTAFRAEEAVLDRTNSSASRANIELMLRDRVLLPVIAGTFNHEYFDYPNPPKTVHAADLDSWKCRWTEGNTPQDP